MPKEVRCYHCNVEAEEQRFIANNRTATALICPNCNLALDEQGMPISLKPGLPEQAEFDFYD